MSVTPTAQGGSESPVLLTLPETATFLRVGRTKLYELMSTGRLRTCRIGGRRFVHYADLLAFIESLRSEEVAT